MQREVGQSTCLITGASSGIGREAALSLAARGLKVLLVCRNRDRGEAVLAEIKKLNGPGRACLFIADLSSQSEVRQLALNVQSQVGGLNILINNAGLVTNRRKVTSDGMEMILAVNHLAPFLLTSLLYKQLKPSARIINVTSSAHRAGTINLEDLHGERHWNVYKAYAQSKLANVLFTYELSRRLRTKGITANCVHPGIVATRIFNNTPLLARLIILPMTVFFVSPSKGAQGLVNLALSNKLESVTGAYFDRTYISESSQRSYDSELAFKLWDQSERLTGIDPLASKDYI